MAATKNGNTWYIAAGTTGNIVQSQAVKVGHVIVTPTSSSWIITLADPVSNNTIYKAIGASGTDTVHTPFEEIPLFFPSGIKVNAATNCDAMLVTEG